MKLEKMYKLFSTKLGKPIIKPKEKETDEKKEEKKEQSGEYAPWNSNILPETAYSKDNSLKNQSENDEIMKMSVGNKKMANILHAIDLELIKKIDASDLVSYDGTNCTQGVTHLINANRGTQNYLKTFEYKDLKKMAKEAELLKNYNIIRMIVTSMETKELDHKKITELKFYRDLLEKQERGVIPFEWMLKDCEDSNMNVESAVASIRFCRIVEKLNDMQEIETIFPLKEKHRHFAYSKMHKFMEGETEETKKRVTVKESLYLVI
ncbi:hypothetical protein ECANGB1_140 [Enterospora canceri]|uniref:Uncharacterized protein n=1 Tax=Enterospora canceri TaxID=1081671 RepID=A0A1Y1S8D4_9MICR|nr:hypothetical protein ECANGB1_140 [Enterospora canceri]